VWKKGDRRRLTMNNKYDKMKDFKGIYEKEGAYHYCAKGFKSWFLKDNYMAIAKECEKENAVLDLGCGEGCLGIYLNVKRLVGIDYSEKALELNRKLYPNVYDELYLGDLRNLEKVKIPDSTLDVVICSLSLMYLLKEDLNKCLKKIYDFLVPQGIFLFTYPTVGPHRKGSPEAFELPIDELKMELIKAHFTIEKLKPICPFIPKNIVEKSEREETREMAYKEYQSAKKRMTLETSYHFICKCRANKD